MATQTCLGFDSPADRNCSTCHGKGRQDSGCVRRARTRISSTGSQIAAMENEVRCNLPQVGKNCLEGAPIAVNIRYYCDSHFVRCPLRDIGLDAGYNFSEDLALRLHSIH